MDVIKFLSEDKEEQLRRLFAERDPAEIRRIFLKTQYDAVAVVAGGRILPNTYSMIAKSLSDDCSKIEKGFLPDFDLSAATPDLLLCLRKTYHKLLLSKSSFLKPYKPVKTH